MTAVLLAGGTGAAKLLRGLVAMVDPGTFTVIGNTGDDLVWWGLHVSPDLDTLIYTLAGLVDESRGWGIKGDTFRCLAAMAQLGAPTWFNVGDQDMATHLYRSERLREGATLHQVTDEIRRKFGVRAEILPMSNDPVRTCIGTPNGWLDFQEFFVREKFQVEVLDVSYEGADRGLPTEGVLSAIERADTVIISPSNPISSIGPITALPWVTAALKATRARVIAVSPIAGGAPVSGPAGVLMAAKGLPVSAVGVAQYYQEWLDILVIDRQDAALAYEIEQMGIRALVTDTIMNDRSKEVALARHLLEAITR